MTDLLRMAVDLESSAIASACSTVIPLSSLLIMKPPGLFTAPTTYTIPGAEP